MKFLNRKLYKTKFLRLKKFRLVLKFKIFTKKNTKKQQLKKNNFLIKKSLFKLKLKRIDILINNKKKYLISNKFNYYNNYILLLKFTKYKSVFYYKMYDLFLSIHNGRYYNRLNIHNLKLTLSVFVETITYGSI